MITTRARLLFVSLLVAPATLLAGPAHAQSDSYDILVTNDDGIESAGIQSLAEALRAVGEVHVVAPCGQRSGSSMSVALTDELTLRPVERDGTALGACVDASPAMAALLAITTLAPEGGFDLIVSGINRGANVGTVSHMSGTIGAAMMGAFFGVPAVAASLGGGRDFDYSARFVAAFVEEMKQHPPMPGVVLSVNIPAATESEITGVTVAGMGGIEFSFAYEEVEGGTGDRTFRPRLGRATDQPAGSDTEAFSRGMITVTPLRFDWTAYEVLDQLREWELSHEIGR